MTSKLRAGVVTLFRVTAHRERAGSGGDSRQGEKVSRLKRSGKGE